MKISIIHTNENGETEAREFENVARIRLGRAVENDVVFNRPEHRSVSLWHAEIEVAGKSVAVVDKGSTNGILVNGAPGSRIDLLGGETVTLGPSGPSLLVALTGRSNEQETALPQPKTVAVPQAKAVTVPQTKTVTMTQVPKKSFGERTVGMMIERALQQAGLIRKTGTSKSTEYFETMVENKLRSTGSRMRWAVIAVIASVVLGGIAVGVYVYVNRSVQYIQTTQVNYGDATGSAIAAANRYAIFLLAGKASSTGAVQGFCTAFAIGENLLATNAHCIATAGKYTDHIALMNGAPANRYSIVRMVAHPGYRDGQISPDVGLVVITGRVPHIVSLASEAELGQVAAGVAMYLYGFPGRLNRVDAPEATFVEGEIGRVTGFDLKLGDFGSNTLLQHSAYSSTGTSGSPMFNAAGRVIGINAGGYVEDGEVLSGYNFGMRIDLIYSLFPLLNAR